jgi:DNA-binding NtrC family response regulator
MGHPHADPVGRPKILLVDDDDVLRTVVGDALVSGGFDVESVADSPTAVAAYVRTRHDLVLTDILMPGCDGLELIRGIRQHDPAARIIAMTGGGTADSASLYLTTAAEFGAFHVLQKPFSTKTLLTLIGDLA